MNQDTAQKSSEIVGTPQMRRVKDFIFSPEVLSDLFTEGTELHIKIRKGVPAKAKVVRAAVSPTDGMLHLMLQHESFPEVPDGGLPMTAVVVAMKIPPNSPEDGRREFDKEKDD